MLIFNILRTHTYTELRRSLLKSDVKPFMFVSEMNQARMKEGKEKGLGSLVIRNCMSELPKKLRQ